MHKLPAAFGLSASVIDQPDMNKWTSLIVIILFTLSAPIGGFLTLAILEGTADEDYESNLAPGVLLLLSAGTVLYVACCHIIPEAFALGDAIKESNTTSSSDDSDDISDQVETIKNNKAPNKRYKEDLIQIGLVLIGLLIPLILVYALPEEEGEEE